MSSSQNPPAEPILLAIIALAVFCGGAEARRARTSEEICLARMNAYNWSQAEFRTCKAQLDEKATADAVGGVCSKRSCAFRLDRVSAGLYRGFGYELRVEPLDFAEGVIRATLTDTSGAATKFEHGCGAGGCPGSAEWTQGAHRGATYQEIGEAEDPSAVLLHIPR
jgi:hypothetical protein